MHGLKKAALSSIFGHVPAMSWKRTFFSKFWLSLFFFIYFTEILSKISEKIKETYLRKM